MLLTESPFKVLAPTMSFVPRCAACRGDRPGEGGEGGAVGGQIRRAREGRKLGAGSREEIRRDTVESEGEVSELGGDSLGATRHACLLGGWDSSHQRAKMLVLVEGCSAAGRNGGCSKNALTSFWVFPCAGHHVSSSSARLKTAALFKGLRKGLHPPVGELPSAWAQEDKASWSGASETGYCSITLHASLAILSPQVNALPVNISFKKASIQK